MAEVIRNLGSREYFLLKVEDFSMLKKMDKVECLFENRFKVCAPISFFLERFKNSVAWNGRGFHSQTKGHFPKWVSESEYCTETEKLDKQKSDELGIHINTADAPYLNDESNKNIKFNNRVVNSDEVEALWTKYNEYSDKISVALGRTKNIVGEYGEYLAFKKYKGTHFTASNLSADIRGENGKLYQVKARKLNGSNTTQLSVIRSWNFDYLVVILFDSTGLVRIAKEIPVSVAREYGVKNTHQNGWVITTTNEFLSDKRAIDITNSIKQQNT